MEKFSRNVLAPLVVRLGLSVIFIYNGMVRLGPNMSWGTAWDLSASPLPAAVQAPVAWGAFLGGVALAIGFLVRLAALGLGAMMIGAIILVHFPHGFALISPDNPTGLGYEYDFALVVLCLGAFLLGSGPLGLDYWLKPRRPPELPQPHPESSPTWPQPEPAPRRPPHRRR
jgi:putative oxidoreductase